MNHWVYLSPKFGGRKYPFCLFSDILLEIFSFKVRTLFENLIAEVVILNRVLKFIKSVEEFIAVFTRLIRDHWLILVYNFGG